MSALNRSLTRLRRYLAEDLWQVRLSEQPTWRRQLLRQLQLWVLVGREFIADRCLLHAMALAFTTLLSIVPLLALMFAVLTRFGVQNQLEPLLLEHLAAGSESVATAIVTYINNTSVGGLGAVGLAGLILTVVSLISGIERSFNDIWGVAETRSLRQRFTGYFSVVTIGPVFVVAAVSMTGSLESQTFVRWLLDLELIGTLLLVLFKILPFMVMWLVFAGLYLLIPNTRVAPRAALLGGVFSGTLWQLTQWAYVDFQVGVARYNAIYGTLAALPIFMVWLYLAWAIVLLGLEATYAVQNIRSVRHDLRGGRVSIAGRTRAVLTVLVCLAQRFRLGAPAPDAEELAADLKIPPRLLQGLLELLQRQGLVVETLGTDGHVGFQPAQEPDTVTVAAILDRLAADGNDYQPSLGCAGHNPIAEVVERLTTAADGALAGMTLRNLADLAECQEKRGDQPEAGG